jgi:hypothetical protein
MNPFKGKRKEKKTLGLNSFVFSPTHIGQSFFIWPSIPQHEHVICIIPFSKFDFIVVTLVGATIFITTKKIPWTFIHKHGSQ